GPAARGRRTRLRAPPHRRPPPRRPHPAGGHHLGRGLEPAAAALMHTHIHNCCVSAIVVDMEVPTAEAARMLDVSQQRIRALIASGILDARQVAGRWLVDADSIDRQAAIATGSRGGRGLAQHVAWAAADLLDRGLAPWLTPKDRWRLRARLLHELDGVDTARRWLRNRYTQASTWRAGPTAIERLLTTDGV